LQNDFPMLDSLPNPELRPLKNGITAEVVAVGPSHGPMLILLHGFPDVWQTWSNQIEPLVAAGFRVLIPNQRGYGRSSKPSPISDYHLDHLANDILALADSEGRQQFQLVGHDWGGIVAWHTGIVAPDRVTRLVVLNAPHPDVFWKYLLTHPTQLLKSWYVMFFQFDWLPEALLRAKSYERLAKSVKAAGPSRINDKPELLQLMDSWSQPGALRSMINYYRAPRIKSQKSLPRRLTMPTLILFSQNDPALETGLARVSEELCDDARLILFEHAQHWLHREKASEVTQKLLKFLSPS